MKIDRTLKIKEKYFNAILRYEKPFELRHFYLAPNSIVRLECVDNNNINTGRYIIFRCGNSGLYEKLNNVIYVDNRVFKFFEKEAYELYGSIDFDHNNDFFYHYDWYDDFCWEYINNGPTYLTLIDEILEVK